MSSARPALRRPRHETLSAERRALVGLRNAGEIGDEALQQYEQDLDVEAIRIGLGELRTSDDGAPPPQPRGGPA